LLEASAIGRPIITTDTVGCRDVVEEGVNGLLCRVADAEDLAEKLLRMVEMSSEERAQMGRAGRLKIEKEFDEKLVISQYLKVIKEINTRRKPWD
jgi:glycosyltransferase involved in cell wall biosynthesis